MRRVFARAPFRLGLAGGGTDVVPYCYEIEGAVVNATISKFCYVSIVEGGETVFKSRDLDQSEQYDPSQPGALLLHFGVHRYFERLTGRPLTFAVETDSEAPAGSGLGSSSTIVVALVKAYARVLNLRYTDFEIAEISITIERDELGLSGGLQDQYAAAFGGVNLLQFTKSGDRIVNRVSVSDGFLGCVESSLLLINSGTSRESARIIEEQKALAQERNQNFLGKLTQLKASAYDLQSCLLREDFARLVEVMQNSWLAKKGSSSKIVSPQIQKIEDDVLASGALAFKVSGAGGGGYCQVYASPDQRAAVKATLEGLGYQTEIISFQRIGAQAWNTF